MNSCFKNKHPEKVLIIAEAGVNHNGNIKLAKKMIDEAASAGADYIKFQTFSAKKMVSTFAPKADYQLHVTNKNESQLEMIKKLELSQADHIELYKYCETKNIKFLSTRFDLDSIDLLVNLGLEIIKIPSGEITNLPYLRKIGSFGKKLILSTGMSTLGEIDSAIEILTRSGTPQNSIVLLHCTTEYPTPFSEVNLNAILTLQSAFGLPVGYSDHTLGIEVPIAAVALGACIIEKHFTLNKNFEGPDHKASLEPTELKQMIQAIRNIEKALGSGLKKPTPSELKNLAIVRKSIVAARHINKGESFSEENLTVKRPGNGLSPMLWDFIIGKPAPCNFNQDDLIHL